MAIKTQPVTVNLGPQHPSTHGVFRMRVMFDGEEIVDVEPILATYTEVQKNLLKNGHIPR